MVLQLGVEGLVEGLTSPHRKKTARYKLLHRASDMDGFFERPRQISGSGQGPVPGCCEHGNELSGSIKGGEGFLDQLG
jgi:hypothetical protein